MTSTGTATRRQLVTFAAGGELFAADIFSVERVLRHTPPRLLPNAAPWLRGVIEHAGTAIPVIDLRERLGLGAAETPAGARILVVVVGDTRIGVTVDEVQAVRAIDPALIEPPPAIYRGLAREYLEGVARLDGELFVVLAITHLLDSTERIEMARALASEGAHV
ncbi:MAG: chemotaxis protein CheW [Gemmatimonadetes bacterium]|nr:chemotaxis protein CheW [Gemmatimonadota bacterium]